ncbi:hypothetical protein BG004_001522, partial [Podila humilis]
PDEYWQALEVGHWITFGSGYLTWEWDVGLRSVLHPAFFAALFKVLAVLGLDDGSFFIYAPRVLQAVFAALGDLYTFRFALRLFENRHIANWTAALTIIALYYWPFTTTTPISGPVIDSKVHHQYRHQASQGTSLTLSLVIASLTCIFRPTAAILWIYLGGSLILNLARNRKFGAIFSTLVVTIVIGGVAILGSAVLDSTLFYNQWILTPINFLRVNLLEGISLFYGSSPWHWYLSQGLPILFGIYLPLVIYGIWRTCRLLPGVPPFIGSSRGTSVAGLNQALKTEVLGLCLWALVVYSSLQHKEWRFLYPILYPLLPFGGDALYNWLLSPQGWKKSRGMAWAVLTTIVATNAIMAWYTTQIHQRGVIDVMDWLRKEMRAGHVRSVGMLMPCHSTPWISSVHLRNVEPVDMWFLTCEPPLGNVDPSYEDESDIFYKDPQAFMIARSNMIPDSKRNSGNSHYGDASHLVIFEVLVPKLEPWLESNAYIEVKSHG